MYEHYNRYSYVLNNPLKYTDPSGWVAMASRLTTVLLPEDYRNNIEGGYKNGGGYSDMGFDYNYAGPYSMYASNPAMYAFMYGTQTWMQTATQNPSSYFNISSNSIYTNNPQKIGSLLNNISRGGTVSGIFEIYGGTAPGITIYSTATGFITNQSSIQNTYNWIQNSLNGIGGSTNNSNVSGGSYLTTTNTILGTIGVGSGAKEILLEYATKVRNIGKSGEKYSKVTNFIGKATGYASAATAWYDYSQNQTTTTFIKAIGNSGIAIMHINPFVGIGLGILDLTGGLDLLYNRIGNYIDNNQWKQKP